MSPGHILSPGKVAMTPQQTREQRKEEKQTWKKTTSEIMRLNNVLFNACNERKSEREEKNIVYARNK